MPIVIENGKLKLKPSAEQTQELQEKTQAEIEFQKIDSLANAVRVFSLEQNLWSVLENEAAFLDLSNENKIALFRLALLANKEATLRQRSFLLMLDKVVKFFYRKITRLVNQRS